MVGANINGQLIKLLKFWGVDRAVAYTVLARGWAVVAGPITFIFLATFLSPSEQGLYYTFASVLGLQVFFEMGVSFVLRQFASYERAKLEWSTQGTLQGDTYAKARLSSLFRMGLLWYAVVAVLVVAIVLPIGIIFFRNSEHDVARVTWELPWILFVVATACNIFLSPIYALLEGCGLVEEVALIWLCQAIFGGIILWAALSQNLRLFASPIAGGFCVLWAICWLYYRNKRFLLDLISFSFHGSAINWWSEVWPFQWKIALSWISNYFIFQFFSPILFAFHGPVAAGQMGLSISVVTSITVIAMAWLNTKLPTFGRLIANRQYEELDRLYFSCLWQSLSVVVFGGMLFWMAAWYFRQTGQAYSYRILDPFPLALLIAATIPNHISFAHSAYLRAHRQEPYLILTVSSACLIGWSTYILGKHYAATGMLAGYLMINLVLGCGVGTWIFLQKRRLWHTSLAQNNS